MFSLNLKLPSLTNNPLEFDVIPLQLEMSVSEDCRNISEQY